MNKQKGFSIVEILLVVLAVGFLGFIGWFVWSKNQKDEISTKSIAQTETMMEDKKSDSAVTEPHLEENEAPASSYIKISEWGVQIPIGKADPKVYSYKLSETGTSKEQTLKITDSKIATLEDPKHICAANFYMARSLDGLFYNSATDNREELEDGIRGAYTKRIGDYYYRVLPGQGCGYDEILTKKIDELYSEGLGSFNWNLENLTEVTVD